jgi:hypothetical protein
MTKTLEFTPDNKITQLWVLLEYLEKKPYIQVTIHTDDVVTPKMRIYKNPREITGEFPDVASLMTHLDAITK